MDEGNCVAGLFCDFTRAFVVSWCGGSNICLIEFNLYRYINSMQADCQLNYNRQITNMFDLF